MDMVFIIEYCEKQKYISVRRAMTAAAFAPYRGLENLPHRITVAIRKPCATFAISIVPTLTGSLEIRVMVSGESSRNCPRKSWKKVAYIAIVRASTVTVPASAARIKLIVFYP